MTKNLPIDSSQSKPHILDTIENAIVDIQQMTDTGIPFYAYGDNEAGCQMMKTLMDIYDKCNQVMDILDEERGKTK